MIKINICIRIAKENLGIDNKVKVEIKALLKDKQ